jgi:hypothetical protein
MLCTGLNVMLRIVYSLSGAEIDSKKSWPPPGTFMGARTHPNPDEGI